MGVGGGLSAEPFGDPKDTKGYAAAEASAGVPGVQIGVSGEVSIDPNGCIEKEAKAALTVGVGPVSATGGVDLLTGEPEGFLGWGPDDKDGKEKKSKTGKPGKLKAKAEAKLVAGGCIGVK